MPRPCPNCPSKPYPARLRLNGGASPSPSPSGPLRASPGTPFAVVVTRIGGTRAADANRALLGEHLLPWLSTALPKNIASRLVSLCVPFSTPCAPVLGDTGHGVAHRAAQPEDLRLHPPLFGSAQVIGSSETGVVSGAAVPRRQRLWYSALRVNRDPLVPENATGLCPTRLRDIVTLGRCPSARLRRHKEKRMARACRSLFGTGARVSGSNFGVGVHAHCREEVCATTGCCREKREERGVRQRCVYRPFGGDPCGKYARAGLSQSTVAVNLVMF